MRGREAGYPPLTSSTSEAFFRGINFARDPVTDSILVRVVLSDFSFKTFFFIQNELF